MPRCKKLWTATKNHSLPYLQGCCRLFPQTRTPNKSFVLCWFVGIWPQQQGIPLITRTLSSDYVSVLKGEHQTFRVHWRRILLYCHLILILIKDLVNFVISIDCSREFIPRLNLYLQSRHYFFKLDRLQLLTLDEFKPFALDYWK